MSSSEPAVPKPRPVLVIADEQTLETVRMELADGGPFRVKAATGAREAIAAVPSTQPHAILIQSGRVQARQILMLKQLAELASSRRVPIVMFEGPLEDELEERRNELGIAQVVDGVYRLAPVLEAMHGCIRQVEQMRRTEQIRRNLARAANRTRTSQAPDSEPQ
jgi:PleD family two-component response regulator